MASVQLRRQIVTPISLSVYGYDAASRQLLNSTSRGLLDVGNVQISGKGPTSQAVAKKRQKVHKTMGSKATQHTTCTNVRLPRLTKHDDENKV